MKLNIFFFILFVLVGCTKHDFYFNIEKEEIESCSNSRFRMLEITNEKDAYLIYWNNPLVNPPQNLKIRKISQDYIIRKNGTETVKK